MSDRHSFDLLVATLMPIERRNLAFLVLEAVSPNAPLHRTSSEKKWERIGGIDGFRKLSANANILVALASYADRSETSENKAVVKRMREEAFTLKIIALKLLMRSLVRLPVSDRGRYAIDAASAYYSMTMRILTLFMASESGHYSPLFSRLWSDVSKTSDDDDADRDDNCEDDDAVIRSLFFE